MNVKNFDLLKKLDFNKQLFFAYLICERLYPNYAYFSQNFGFGDKLVIRAANNFIYNQLLSANVSNQSEIDYFLSIVELNTAHTEDFDTIFVSSALDACAAICETLEFIKDRRFDRLNNISTFATDTVDMYVQAIENLDYNNDKDFENKILGHVLMKRELAIQTGAINYLSEIKKLELLDINNLLDLQLNNGKSNIDV